MISLDGKIAIITGGCHGIGRAITDLFGRAGAQVIVGDVDEEASASLACARFVRADVSNRDDLRAVVAGAAGINGRVDILCNNAAYLGNAHAALEASDEEW